MVFDYKLVNPLRKNCVKVIDQWSSEIQLVLNIIAPNVAESYIWYCTFGCQNADSYYCL
jgi:hypothetical protein